MPKNLLFAIFILIVCRTQAQDFNMGAVTYVKTCKGFLNDSGGANGKYGKNELSTMTICSDGSSSLSHISLQFNSLLLGQGDRLCFYDGPNTQAPLLTCDDQLPTGPFIVQATAGNTSGCLTISFSSNATDEGQGWNALINCVASCQRIEAVIAGSNPVSLPTDTGWIDLCQREVVVFSGRGNYPQNGVKYNHSDATSKFEWNFGDGTIKYGQNVSHAYSQSGGYIVSLTVTDQLGCKSTNFIKKRVRIAPTPNFFPGTLLPGQVCVGDTLRLKGDVNKINPGGTISVLPGGGIFRNPGIRSDSLALPDGDGTAYRASIRFTDFAPGQTLTNISDLLGICANMEHTWLRDLQITIECPNGQSAVLHNYAGHFGNKVVLGKPVEKDTINPIPGTGYTYCWKYNATNAPWLQYINGKPSLDTLSPGDYKSYENLNQLIGCPLNGEWTLIVQDLWAKDNGFIFNWGIDFNPALYPPGETFAMSLTDYEWLKSPSIFFQSKDSIAALANLAGSATYTFRVKDNFGCWHDSSMTVQILPPTHPACRNCAREILSPPDVFLCRGDKYQLDASYTGRQQWEVPFAAFPNYRFGYSNHPPSIPYVSPLDISYVYPNTITDATKDIRSVCLDIDTDYDGDLQIFLESPSGQTLELSTNNGGNGSNFTNTCFTPSASVPVTAGSAPFTGNFQPEGNWANLNGSPVTGTWKLKVGDAYGVNQYGVVKSWSIVFNAGNNIAYSWTPAGGLSCNNCPNPVASPAATTSYLLKTTDSYGCSFTDTVTVNVVNRYPAPLVSIDTFSVPGKAIIRWEVIPGAKGYEISINGQSWTTPNGALWHEVTGLKNGDPLFVQVRVQSSNSPCGADIGTVNAMYRFCPMKIAVAVVQEPRCFNTKDGRIVMDTKQTIGTPSFFINGISNGTSGVFGRIGPGNYRILVQDSLGCFDSVLVNVPGRDSIAVQLTVDSIKCQGDLGAITAQAFGGKGKLSLLWNTTPPTSSPTIGNIPTGTYILTVRDTSNCILADTVVLQAPPALQLTLRQDSVSCFGGKTGRASVSVTGGKPGYVYFWENKTKAPVLDNLQAGMYRVSIVDANNCLSYDSVQVLQPAPLQYASDSTIVRCNGGNDGRASVFPAGGSAPYRYQWGDPASQTTATALGLKAGYFPVTITDKNDCVLVGGVIVNENAAMTLQSNTTNATCNESPNGAVQISVGNSTPPLSFVWNNNAALNDSTNTGLLAGLYLVTVTDGNGCKKIAKAVVSAPPPLVIAMNGVNATCSGKPDGRAVATPTGGTPPYIFRWNDPLTQTSDTAASLAPGLYTCTITDLNGCSKTDTFRVRPPSSLMVDSIVAIPVRCFGGNDGKAQVFVSGGMQPYSYKWNDPFGQFLNPAMNLKAGLITVTVTDAANCVVVATVSVTEPPRLTLTTASSSVRCFGGSDGIANSFALGGTPSYQYLWSDGQTTQDASGLSAGNYRVTVTDRNGCTSSATVSIGQPLAPLSADAVQYYQPCDGAANGKARIVYNGGTGPGYTYLWSNGEKTDTAVTLRQGTYTVTVTDQNGCKAVDSVEIKALAPIAVTFIRSQPTCFDGNDGQLGVNFVTGGAGGGIFANYRYTWNTTPIQTGALISNLKSATYTVTVTDNQGCTGTAQALLDQPPRIRLTLGSFSTKCFGSRDGSAAVLKAQGNNPTYTYRWDANAASQSNPTAINLAAGTYGVTVTDNLGCRVDTFVTVDQPEKVRIDRFEVKNGLCDGDTLGRATAYALGGTAPYRYAWSTGATGQTATGLQAGIYSVTATDFYGCTGIATTQLVSTAALDGTLTASDVSCPGSYDGRIRVEPLNGARPYQFSIDGLNFSSANLFIGLRAGKYAIHIRDGNGCTWRGETRINEPPPIKVSAGPDLEIALGDSVRLSATVSNQKGTLTFLWSEPYKGSLSCLQCPSPWAKPSYSIRYEVSAIDSLGCEGTDTIEIRVARRLGVAVPTAFTPNSDNANDLLLVHGVEGTKVRLFRIYNQWGELLYENGGYLVNDTRNGWDGSFRGEPAPTGTYVWYLTVENPDGSASTHKGNVTLIR